MYRYSPANQKLTFHFSIAESFLIHITFRITIINLAHGRVTPIDDPNIGSSIDVGGSSDEHFAIARTTSVLLSHGKVREVGVARVDEIDAQFITLRADARKPLHLGE